MLYCVRYARILPYETLLIAAILNMTVIVVFVFRIKAEYLRTKQRTQSSSEPTSGVPPQLSAPRSNRRLVALWVGAGLYFLAFITGIGYGIALAGRVPLPMMVFAELFNAGILAAFLWAIREEYKKRKA